MNGNGSHRKGGNSIHSRPLRTGTGNYVLDPLKCHDTEMMSVYFTNTNLFSVEPLKNIIGVSEQNQTMPILGHVLLEIKDGVCFLTATDLEVQVSFSYDIGVSENIRITVPARKFTDILRSLEAEDVSLELTPKDIVIKSGKSKFQRICQF